MNCAWNLMDIRHILKMMKIIEEIFHRIGCRTRIFTEFGVEDGLESNCHLLLHKGWSGLWIEGNQKSYRDILYKFHPVIRQDRLKVIQAFITKENINDLIRSAGISGEIDLLSIDVDGNDYYIWEAVSVINPMVVVIEYNRIPTGKWLITAITYGREQTGTEQV